MASKLITPPDHDSAGEYLLVNASTDDISLVARWLQFQEKDYIIHLYHDGMNDPEWLTAVSKTVKTCLVDRTRSSTHSLAPMMDNLAKIIWYSKDHAYTTPLEYFVSHG